MPNTVEKLTEFAGADLSDLCQATEDAIDDGIGFNWVSPPVREVLESYWKGVLMVPERTLFVGRLDGVIVASIQLVKPSKSRETSAFCAGIEGHFVAPWARGHGLAKQLLETAEREAAKQGFSSLKLDVRSTQSKAITLYRESEYIEWGVLPHYEYVNGNMVSGHFFYKQLSPLSELI
ncbi:MAG: GNAT family N-acetyltransferase [Rickettsiales bacterium]|nr:GNAT family N-acetyltransferase [Rickettsiales bacterium]